ncbi:MAG: hypothetical protein Q7R39_08470, partial [Dehalococcoidia bacterium]|nr:hypothetical protein [Dehalococcoidia bacterium]
QIRTVRFQKRQQAYPEIMGRKFLLMQLYVSRFEARIFSDYHEQRWRNSPDSLDLSEAQRWMHKSEDLALEIAKTNQSLFESIGLVKASFRRDDELDTLTQHIYHFRTPTIIEPPGSQNAQGLDTYGRPLRLPNCRSLSQKNTGSRSMRCWITYNFTSNDHPL